MSELFVEIGTEELPAHAVGPAVEALAAGLVKLLGPIAHGEVRTFGTPRRLAVAISDVASARPAVERLVTGPPVAQAFPNGEPGPVAEAFAKARGVAVEQLLQVDTPKGKVIAVRRIEGGERTAEVVGKGLEAAVLGIPFKKSMRWVEGSQTFSRPIRSICALFAGEVIEASVAGVLTSGNSHGHWLYAFEGFRVTSADQWLAELRERFVVADVHERRTTLLEQLVRLAADRDADAVFGTDLVDEVVQLVEWPRTLVGRFDAALLELPPRLLVESMKKNQRYFPLYRNGELTNEFLVTTNNPFGDDALIGAGNARVLAARFHDARFFYAEDRKKRLEEHGARLTGMTWIRGLGTMADRQASLVSAVSADASRVGLARLFGADEAATARAAALSKCDLTTQMVGEFPELQGHVGRLLAELDGESALAARAIEEHYHPRFSDDTLPTSREGLALAVAERTTLLTATFGKGLVPKGGADPLGLRRAAGGLLSLLLLPEAPVVPVHAVFDEAGLPFSPELRDFVLARLRALLQEDAPADLVDAVMAVGPEHVKRTAERVRALRELPKDDYAAIRQTFKRAAGLVKEHRSTEFSRELFRDDAETALADAIWTLPAPGARLDESLAALLSIRPVLARFFDAVLVMEPDMALRNNRLGMLRAIVENFGGLADFTRLSGD